VDFPVDFKVSLCQVLLALFLYSYNSANKLCVSWELLEYKGTGSKHLTQTCEVLKAYDTELAENRDKKSYRGKEIDM
jgi:hypothetical protein